MSEIKFATTPQDGELINLIVDRAVGLMRCDRLELTMDITACHLNGMPLNLQRLLDADDFNFFHDVGGIHRHIDRETGQLGNCFVPRFHVSD